MVKVMLVRIKKFVFRSFKGNRKLQLRLVQIWHVKASFMNMHIVDVCNQTSS